jgi:hypothetical protein
MMQHDDLALILRKRVERAAERFEPPLLADGGVRGCSTTGTARRARSPSSAALRDAPAG